MVGNLVTLSLYGLFQYHSDITSKLIPFMTLSCLLPTEKPIAKRKVFKDLTFDRTFIFLVQKFDCKFSGGNLLSCPWPQQSFLFILFNQSQKRFQCNRRISWPKCAAGWVNLYQKFEIERYTVSGKFIFPKKWKYIF